MPGVLPNALWGRLLSIRPIGDIMWCNAKYRYWAWLIVAVLLASISHVADAALTDIKFGRYQIADSQWNVNACLNTTTCQIYSKQPGTAYKIPWTSGQIVWAAGDYIKFELSGNASYPYLAKQYDSAGNVKATMGTGKIVNMGPDYFFFVGNDNNTGQLFSGSSGMNTTSGVSWTGTLNPTIQQADTYADANYSLDPLAAGQSATNTPGGGGGGAPVYTSDITQTQITALNAARARVNALSLTNKIYIDEKVGSSNNIVLIEQHGFYNTIQGLNGATYAVLDGDVNSVTIKQGGGQGRNLIEISVQGNTNTVTAHQGRQGDEQPKASDSGGHYQSIDVVGNNNTVAVRQRNNGGATSGHSAWVSINGSGNTALVNQFDNNDKRFFGIVTGSNSMFDITQQGTGNHYLDINLSGNGHSVTSNQKDAGSHRATVHLVNAGGPSTVNLVQQGATGQIYNISQNCATMTGCTVTITQGGP